MRGLKRGNERRGQSSPIAVVLVFGLVIASTTIVVLAGGSAIQDTQSQLGTASAENSMTQLDSQASLVALGQSNSQRVDIGSSGTTYQIDGTAGWMNVSYNDGSSTTKIMDATMGSVTYEGDDNSRIAYQGGGVWRAGPNGGSTMISPPEFHYREKTLTLPLVTIDGDRSVSGNVALSYNNTTKHYPNSTLRNPLKSGNVTIEIKSEYHEAWEAFFEDRTGVAAVKSTGDQRVKVTLTAPRKETFNHAVTATSDDSDAIDESSTSPNGGFDSPTETGVPAQSMSSRIDNKISDCGGANNLTSNRPNLDAGTYCHTGDISIDETTYDTSDGNVSIVVDGDLEFAGSGGPPGTVHHKITGDNTTTFYVKGDVDISGNTRVNSGGDPSQLLVTVHSNEGNVTTASGTPQFTGLIYAPSASLSINGGGNPSNDNIQGAVVVKNATANGNGNLEFDGSIDYTLEFEENTGITYLHVSENSVNVTDN